MKREDDQQLWDLLGKTKPVTLSPFFARNVLREIRQEKSRSAQLLGWFAPAQLIPAAAVALALFTTMISVRLPMANLPDNPPPVVASIDPADYEAVADLDDLLTPDDDGLWNDSDSSQL